MSEGLIQLCLSCMQCVKCAMMCQIRKEYFTDQISAGPQSTVLEGVTWEEAQRIKVCDLSLHLQQLMTT